MQYRFAVNFGILSIRGGVSRKNVLKTDKEAIAHISTDIEILKLTKNRQKENYKIGEMGDMKKSIFNRVRRLNPEKYSNIYR